MKKNRFNSILLVNLYYVQSGYGEKLNYPPLGIGYISENLKANGFECYILDIRIKDDLNIALKKVNDVLLCKKPEIIGFSLNSININESMKLIEKLKKDNLNIKIILGGPHISSKQKSILEEYGYIDYISIHEGEYTLKELMKGEDEKHIKGLGYRINNDIYLNPSEAILNLDNLKWPKYENFDLDIYQHNDEIGILTSRGCPYRCGFCQQSSLIGKKWRGRTAENIVEEIQHWKNNGIRKIHIIDDMFLMDKERVLKLSELICEKELNDIEFISVGGFRINHCDYETLVALKKMGVKVATFGVESTSDRVLKFIKKDINRNQIEEVIKNSCEIGFRVKLFFIIGLPTQTKQEIEETFDFVKKYPISQVRFFNFIPYEETFLMDWLKNNNCKFYYTYDQYMANFKKFQDIPIFQDDIGMTVDEKKEVIRRAREIEKDIDNNSN